MNLVMIMAGVGLLALMHLSVGMYGTVRLARGLVQPAWQQTLCVSALAALFFVLAFTLWIVLLFAMPRSTAPMAVLNTPAWIVLGTYLAGKAVLRQATSFLVFGWEGVALAVPACSLFASVYYEPLKQIFGPIRTW